MYSAAEVVAVGSAVADFKLGDHVCPIIALENITGQEENSFHSMPGSDIDGVLREYAVYEDKVLVHLPKNLSWEEVRLHKHKQGDSIISNNQHPGIDNLLCRSHGLECVESNRLICSREDSVASRCVHISLYPSLDSDEC